MHYINTRGDPALGNVGYLFDLGPRMTSIPEVGPILLKLEKVITLKT